MESEDLNPRSIPARSSSVPLFFTPAVPEVSLMLNCNNSQWQTSKTFSPVENMSRMSGKQKYSTRYGESTYDMARSKNTQPSKMSETEHNVQKVLTPKSYVFHGYNQQLEKFHSNSDEKRESNYRNKYIARAFENADKYQNISTNTGSYGRQQIENTNTRPEDSNQYQGHFQPTPGLQINATSSKGNEHYKGWRTYFDDGNSGAQNNIQFPPRSVNSFQHSPEEMCNSDTRTFSQNQRTSAPRANKQMQGNNKEHKTEVTESELQNLIIKVISNLENSPGLQNKEVLSLPLTIHEQVPLQEKCELKKIAIGEASESELQSIILKIVANLGGHSFPLNKETLPSSKNMPHTMAEITDSNSKSSVQSKELYGDDEHMAGTYRENVTSSEREIGQYGSNSPLLEENKIESDFYLLDKRNTKLTSDRNKSYSSSPHDGKRPSKSQTAEVQQTCNKKCECHVSFAKLYKILQLQSSCMQALQEKVDKVILQQQKNLRILGIERTNQESETRSRRVSHVSTQTTIGFSQREIAVGTEPQKTASVGVMAVTYDPQKNFEEAAVFSRESKQMPMNTMCKGPRRPRCEETINEEDIHNEDSICLNSLDLPSVQVQAPSPMPSIHVDMQDFEDDDSDSESSQCSNSNLEVQQSSRVGWTFYNNVVEQVNKILNEQPSGKTEKKGAKQGKNKEMLNDNSLHAVRTATLEQLKRMGINSNREVDQVDCAQRVDHNFDHVYCPRWEMPFDNEKGDSDSSLQIKALAMKYLKEDNFSSTQLCNISMKGTNFSMATLKYMERYHLLPFPGEIASNPQAQTKAGQNVRPSGNLDKILDVTAIKNQPKLL